MSQSSAQQLEKRWQLLTDITTQREVGHSKRITYAIQRALDLLKLDIGILSSIKGESYTVVEFVAPEGALHRGQVFNLGDTYCAITLKAEHVIAIDYMKESEHNRHPCYAAFQLETYIGTPVFVQGKRFGTLNFSNPNPHATLFEEEDKQLVDLLANWVGSELEQQAYRNQFADVLSAISLPMLIIRVEDSVVRYANPEASELAKVPLDQLIGEPVPKFYANPEDDQRIIDLVEAQGSIRGIPIEIVNPLGERFWVSMSTQLINYQGDLCGLSTFLDITEQRQIFDELQESQEDLSAQLEASPEGIGLLNTQTGLFESPNKNLLDIFDLSHDELIKLGPNQLSPEFQPDGTRSDQKSMGLVEAALEGEIVSFEWLHLNSKGKEIPCAIRLSALRGKRAHLVRFNITDITEHVKTRTELQKRARELESVLSELQENQDDLRLQYESSPEAIGILNTQTGLFENPNKNAEVLYGLPYDELIKVGPAQMSPEFQPDGRPSGEKAMEKVGEALQGGRPVFEWVHLNGAGEEVQCEVRLAGLGGTRTHLLRFSVTDISERIAAQAEIGKRARQLEVVTEVSTKIAAIQDLDEMLQTMVDLTKDRFDLYHTHVFLTRDGGLNLSLAKGAGEVGRHMVAEGRTIPLDAEGSLVATSARKRSSQIREYQGEMEGYMPHPFLIETRAEMALPLIAGDELVGVLDVRSDQFHGFDVTEQQIFETLAAQVAISIRNAQSFAESERNRYELDMLTRRLTREGWQDYFQTDGQHRYGLDRSGHEILMTDLPQISEDSEELDSAYLDEILSVQGEDIGQIKLHNVSENSDDLQSVLAAVADSLSTHIESLRLSEQTHNALTDADILYQVTTKLNAAQTYNEILEAIATQAPIARNAKYIGLNYFDKAWTDEQRPESAEAIALWHDGESLEPTSFHKFKLKLFAKTMRSIQPDRPLLVSNMITDERVGDPFRNIYLNAFKCKSNAIFPLMLGTLWIGYLDLVYEDPTEFNPAEVERFTTLAQQIAISSQTIFLNQQRAKSLAETATLYQGSERISRASTYGDALRALIDSLDVVRDRFDYAHLLLFDKAWQDEHSKPRYMILHGDWEKESDQISESNISIPLSTFATDVPFKRDGPHYIPDVDQEESFSPYLLQGLKNNYGTKSILDLPLISSGEWIGRLSLHSKGDLPTLTEDEMRLVSNLTDQLATVAQGLRLFNQAQARAEREAQVRNITNQIRRGNNQQEIVQIARQEIAALLKASKSESKLGTTAQLRQALQKRSQTNGS